MQKWRKPATVLMSWDVIIAKSSKSAHTFAPLTSVCRNGLNPQGSYPLHPLMREQSGGCESADHPNLPARPREMCCLFGSGSSGLGLRNESSHRFTHAFAVNVRSPPNHG